MTDSASHQQLPDADRDRARSAARTQAVQAAEHYARLLAVEAAIASRAEFPDLSRLVFRLGEDIDGPSVTLVAAYHTDGRQLWHEDDGQEWPDDPWSPTPSPPPPNGPTVTTSHSLASSMETTCSCSRSTHLRAGERAHPAAQGPRSIVHCGPAPGSGHVIPRGHRRLQRSFMSSNITEPVTAPIREPLTLTWTFTETYRHGVPLDAVAAAVGRDRLELN